MSRILRRFTMIVITLLYSVCGVVAYAATTNASPLPTAHPAVASAMIPLWQLYCAEHVEEGQPGWTSWQPGEGYVTWVLQVQHDTTPHQPLMSMLDKEGRLYYMLDGADVRAAMLVAPDETVTWAVLHVCMGQELESLQRAQLNVRDSETHYPYELQEAGKSDTPFFLYSGNYFALLSGQQVYTLPDEQWMDIPDYITRLASPGVLQLEGMPAPLAEAVTTEAWRWSASQVSEKAPIMHIDISEIPRSVDIRLYGPVYHVDVKRSLSRTLQGLNRTEAGWLVRFAMEERDELFLFQPDNPTSPTFYHRLASPVTVNALESLDTVFQLNIKRGPSYWLLADQAVIAWTDLQGEYAAACQVNGMSLPYAMDSLTVMPGNELLVALRAGVPAASSVTGLGVGLVVLGLVLAALMALIAWGVRARRKGARDGL